MKDINTIDSSHMESFVLVLALIIKMPFDMCMREHIEGIFLGKI
ncbi:MAG TPA: hypothetical protein PLA01_08505 [Acetivibrio sp.]|nr:hypothetical protein [Acetivibrio sp.]